MKFSIETINEDILLNSQAHNYSGYDPFDSLNSKFFTAFPKLKKGYLV